MALAIFDLDNTLIAGDSDHLWGEFLVEKNIVDAELFKQKNDEFYQDYVDGKLDIYKYIEFSLSPLAENDIATLDALHEEFMAAIIRPIMLAKAKQLIEEHRKKGDTLLVITATNRFVTEPIVNEFGIDNLLAIEVEQVNGRYTGKSAGVPSFKEGKVTRLQDWLKETGHDLHGAYFYSDSHNDIPLLELVDTPMVVDGDEQLLDHAKQKNWKCISLRD
ncbi:phosphoserine phosphatase [Oleiphilus sp. HI0071]|uniref:histidinol-phosphatase n=1 Tax=unclassified Oleiphilus TaxID=2631174 RepID=UPI0007C38AC3|nr:MULTISPECIES: HAD family hydrolase [unclassified Oleiphilus]KZY74604.1 phosphoserine phosphatase [Oleiphilus sp. HI0065]KZY82709.1 phosphoserine phosphatase [Oleiphilus sp. HI0071]KZZ05504.1 phosphoserine phosphatase [Oleiphilus sp. HI0073]KZZ51210.1 phosphoserine phosphatase [Oleiphilus sp. HI0122]KZZ52566.1 phosphoserine phosphatase [Oleiphilus sp. HI0118]KZZ81399.1 phosphoserine phosphatase [Oleiphilus sp. HI0133]